VTRPYHSLRPTLRQRILTIFVLRHGRPIHYTRIAQQLGHRKPRRVREACWRLWCQGRLAWYTEGVYHMPRRRQQEGRHA
jgi:hypothetical protein